MNRTPAKPDAPYPHPLYAWYVVVVLLLAYILAFIDREIIAMLVPDIRHDLGISDTQISFLLGGAFAVFYTFFGIALAWLADSSNRRWIIFGGIAVWSLMTAACGMATTYPGLFMARVGVGAGEAALNPSALSIMKDYFPKERLGRAIGLYSAGISSGGGVANIIGGKLYPVLKEQGPIAVPFLGVLAPWQQVFIWVGLPGLLVALLVLTIREPFRRDRGGDLRATPVNVTLAYLRREWRTYILLYLALAMMGIMAYGIGFWVPELLRRTYGLNPAELGGFMAMRGKISIFSGLLGVFVGGWLADRAQRKHLDGYLRLCIGAYVVLSICYITMPLMPTPTAAVWMMLPTAIAAAAATAGGSTAIVTIAPANMRAQIIAFYYFTLNTIGFFIGPTAVALLTDYGFADEAKLRYSLSIVGGGACLFGLVMFAFNRRHFCARMAEVNAAEAT